MAGQDVTPANFDFKKTKLQNQSSVQSLKGNRNTSVFIYIAYLQSNYHLSYDIFLMHLMSAHTHIYFCIYINKNKNESS